MIALHVQLAKRILHDTWRLQHHLIQRRGTALRQRLDVLLAEAKR